MTTNSNIAKQGKVRKYLMVYKQQDLKQKRCKSNVRLRFNPKSLVYQADWKT